VNQQFDGGCLHHQGKASEGAARPALQTAVINPPEPGKEQSKPEAPDHLHQISPGSQEQQHPPGCQNGDPASAEPALACGYRKSSDNRQPADEIADVLSPDLLADFGGCQDGDSDRLRLSLQQIPHCAYLLHNLWWGNQSHPSGNWSQIDTETDHLAPISTMV
jgi:hypothetical protein